MSLSVLNLIYFLGAAEPEWRKWQSNHQKFYFKEFPGKKRASQPQKGSQSRRNTNPDNPNGRPTRSPKCLHNTHQRNCNWLSSGESLSIFRRCLWPCDFVTYRRHQGLASSSCHSLSKRWEKCFIIIHVAITSEHHDIPIHWVHTRAFFKKVSLRGNIW